MSEFDWQPVSNAACDGSVVGLRFGSRFGAYESLAPYILHDDGHWYLTEPPTLITQPVTHFRHLRKGEVDGYHAKLRRRAQRVARKAAA